MSAKKIQDYQLPEICRRYENGETLQQIAQSFSVHLNAVWLRIRHRVKIRTQNTYGGLTLKHKRAFNVWQGMIRRCTNPSHRSFVNYGGRGITVCDNWKRFDRFLQEMGDPPENLTLDRIDNDKGYFRENCRWATPAQQSRNSSQVRLLTIDGETHCLGEWCEISGTSRSTIRSRLSRGFSPEEAVFRNRMKP